MLRLRLPVLTRAEKTAFLILAGILGSGGALRAWEHSGITLGPVRDWETLQRLIVQAGGPAADSTFPCFTPPPLSESPWPKRSQPLVSANAQSVSHPSPSKKTGPRSPLNLNTAGVDALMKLPGVGPSTAQAIVASRASQGFFQKPESLLRVKGIGAKKFAALRKFVTAGE